MASPAEAFAQALRLHRAGDLSSAEPLYRQDLQRQPDHLNALQLLGTLLHQRGQPGQALDYLRRAGALCPAEAAIQYNLALVYQALNRPEEAVVCYRQALAWRPAWPEALINLGNVLGALEQPQEAIGSFRRALEFQPDSPEAHNNLGNVLANLGQREEAVACFRRALAVRPDYAEAHHNLGNALRDLGRLEEAVASCQQALCCRPEFPEAHNNLGNALRDLGRLEEAVASYRRALQLRLDYAEAHNNLGNVLRDLGKPEDAVVCCRRSLHLQPGCPEAHNNLGNALRDLSRLDEAVSCYRQALQLRPYYVEALSNLGAALGDLGRLEEAIACCGQALHGRPDFAEAHRNRALLWLKLGDYVQGWPEWEWRKRCPDTPARPLRQPCWDGSALAARTILLYAEQGLGDTLQFIRYAPLVKACGGSVVVECQISLLRLLAGCAGIDQLLAQGDPLPAFDVQAPLMSLPGIFGTTLESVPVAVPYLHADPSLAARWRQELDAGGFKVGIAWQGNLGHKADRRRSVPLASFAPLAEVAGVRLFSLQKGPGTEQLSSAGFPIVDLGSRLADFADTAAVMQALDLVVAVDTAVIHCAGGLGVPAWVALPFASDWRWLLDREDSPWYPSLRLFRQPQPGAWDAVFARMVAALRPGVPA